MRGIPKKFFENCEGLVLVSAISNSFLVSGIAGTGIVIGKKEDGSWGLPCACGMTGTGWGVGVGATLDDILVFILNRDALLGSANKIGVNLGTWPPATR